MGSWRAGCVETRTSGSEVRAEETDWSKDRHRASARPLLRQPDAVAVADQLDSIAGKLGRQFPAVETMLRETATDVCAFTAFPIAH